MGNPKIIFIEWDGATWEVINELLAKGRLPRLERVIEKGVAGILASEHPYISPRLWTSIFSGKRSNKHGVEFFGANSGSLKCKRIWDIAEAHGLRIGIFGTLVTWPPRPVNGFMIPSVFALGPECHPPELQFLQELVLNERKRKERPGVGFREGLNYARKLHAHGAVKRSIGPILSYLASEKLLRPGFLDYYWRKALIHLRLTSDVFAHLHSKMNPHFATFHVHLCDAISHRYWAFWEPEKFANIPPDLVERFHNVIPRAYQEVDRAIGRIAALADADTTLIIGSDHGFGPQQVAIFPYSLRVNEVLKVLNLENKVLPAQIARSTYLYFQDDDLRGQVKRDLMTVRLGNSDVQMFTVREEGNYLEILIKGELLTDRIADDTRVDFGRWGEHSFGMLFTKVGLHISGVHQPEAVLVLSGNAIKHGAQLQSPGIYDLAPTMLSLLGLPVGEDMDGRVLSEVVSEEFLRLHPLTFVPTHETEGPQPSSQEELDYEKIKERLRSLGYL
jgi:hypothetical protein